MPGSEPEAACQWSQHTTRLWKAPLHPPYHRLWLKRSKIVDMPPPFLVLLGNPAYLWELQ